jgi:hypothetical protein
MHEEEHEGEQPAHATHMKFENGGRNQPHSHTALAHNAAGETDQAADTKKSPRRGGADGEVT